MKKDTFITGSRRRTPWTDNGNATPLQRFIDSVISERYKERHPGPGDTEESTLLNSYTPRNCPYCGNEAFIRYGHGKNGLVRYKCKRCDRILNILTGTLFQDHRISITEWIDFCLGLFRFQSFSSISRSNRNSYTTTKYWLAKILLLLDGYQDGIILSGDVYIDEIYYAVRKADKEKKDNGDEYRGLSRNQICIGIGYDGKKTVAYVEGKGKTSKKRTWTAFSSHIEKGAHLIHDQDASHEVLVSGLGLTEMCFIKRKSPNYHEEFPSIIIPVSRVGKESHLYSTICLFIGDCLSLQSTFPVSTRCP